MLELLSFNPAIDRYVHARYGDVLQQRTTVSLHLRLGYAGEPDKQNVQSRRSAVPKRCALRAARRAGALPTPRASFLQRAMDMFAGNDTVFAVFSDNLEQAAELLAPAMKVHSVVLVDEGPVVSLRFMSLCRNHILSSSTLAFWGAYLDVRQPGGGRTVLHDSFFRAHGRGMIPYDEWVVLSGE